MTFRFSPMFVTLLISACATLNTSGMSEQCRDLYNACLNSCPQASRRAPTSDFDRVSQSSPSGPGLDPGTAKCTNDCNDLAKSCERTPASK